VPTENSSERPATAPPPTADDICRALEEDAAENEPASSGRRAASTRGR
jgi:hypothetical protein